MKRKLLTDVELRSRWRQSAEQGVTVEEGTIITPAAQDFIREQGIRLRIVKQGVHETMTRTPVPVREGKAVYKDAATGRELSEKPEEMTHLRGNLLVPKTHPRIEFRGRLDSLMAEIIETQLTAAEEVPLVADELEELHGSVRAVLGAEVKDEPLPERKLLGMDSAELRYCSHHIKETLGIDHPVPDYRMGKLCAALNRLRTLVRETELSAARAFQDGEGTERPDIIEALNRLSSCVYILFCRKLSGYYDRRSGA